MQEDELFIYSRWKMLVKDSTDVQFYRHFDRRGSPLALSEI